MLKSSGLFDRFRKKIGLYVSIVVILIIGYTIIREWKQLIGFPWSINCSNLLLSVICYTVQLTLMFLIWHFIIKSLSLQSNFKTNINAFFLSALAKRIPTPIPFVGVRFEAYKYTENRSTIVIVGSFLEAITLIAAGMIVSLVFELIQSVPRANNTWVIWAILIIVLVSISPKVIGKIYSILISKVNKDNIRRPIKHGDALLWISLSALSYLVNGLMVYFTINGVTNNSISFSTAFLPASIYYLLTYITMYLFGGFGVKEIVFGMMLNQQILFAVAVIISLVMRLLMIFVEFLGFIIIQKVFPQKDINQPSI